MTTPAVPSFPAGYKPSDADFNGWWYSQAAFFASGKPCLRARQTGTTTTLPTSGAVTQIHYDTIDEDVYGGWNGSTFTWLAPISGWYQVNVLIFAGGFSALNMIRPCATSGSYNYNLASTLPPTGHNGGVRGSFPVYLTGGQDSVGGAAALLTASVAVSTTTTAGQLSALDVMWIST